MSNKPSGDYYRKRKKEKQKVLKKVPKISTLFKLADSNNVSNCNSCENKSQCQCYNTQNQIDVDVRKTFTPEPIQTETEHFNSNYETSCNSCEKKSQEQDYSSQNKTDVDFENTPTPEPVQTQTKSVNSNNQSSCDSFKNKPHTQDNNSQDEIDADFENAFSPETIQTKTEILPEPIDIEIDSSDKGNFPEALTTEQKRKVIGFGPYQPKGPFPKDVVGRNKNRGFHEKYYYKYSGHIKIKRQWLCYSLKRNICYCQPCWLFDTSKGDLSFIRGTSDWAHLARNISKHEESNQHAISCEVYYRWKSDSTIDILSREEINDAINYWRKVLRRIVDVTLTLAINNLPFRAHRITDFQDVETSQGNFIEIIKLLSRYDDVLADLLKRPKGTTNYLSPEIQNELINLIAHEINIIIKSEIDEAAFVTIIADTTQDISKIDQLSIVIRYVVIRKDDNDRPVELQIKEAFCGFTKVTDQTSQGLETIVLEAIECFADITKLRGQGYDGAAHMSGVYSGLQARIRQRNPFARFVHCCTHNLNLVINDSVTNVQEVRQFYEQLEGIYVFFSSPRRWAMLNATKQTNLAKTLKRICPTRWSSRIQALDALRSRYFDVIKILTYLSLNGKNYDEQREAKGLINYFEKFSTIILIIIESKVLEPINTVSKMLQGSHEDIEKSVLVLSSLLNQFQDLRNNWMLVKNDAIELSAQWNIEPSFPKKRLHRVKKFFDELQVDERIENNEDCFKVEVFYRVMDLVINQLTTRFNSLQHLCTLFKCLSPSYLVESSDKHIMEGSELLQSAYPSDISSSFGPQLIRFKMCFYNELKEITSIREVAELILIHTAASSSFSDIISACLIFLTLPLTTATAERSFSKLKLIKTYLRSSMSQHRLSSLATISIERKMACQLDLEKIIDQFANEKARKRQF